MSVRLSDLSEEDRALVLQQAREELEDKPKDQIYSSQVKYFNQQLSEFSDIAQIEKTYVSDKVRPFVSYLMKMKLLSKYGFKSNCQSRAKTSNQLDDFKLLTNQVFDLMYDALGLRR